MSALRYLLLQMRDADDPMAAQEVRCFAKALACDPSSIEVLDLLSTAPSRAKIDQVDMLLLGGSGHHSAASESAEPSRLASQCHWLDRTLDCLREIHHLAKPTFASCWGFQAMARALGGRCIHDPKNSELGTVEISLTDAGRADPVLGALPSPFLAQGGHEDHVVSLPPDSVLLASSAQIKQQAFRFIDRPIYCTQFHPELDRESFLERVAAYPEYVERIVGSSYDDFVLQIQSSPAANQILKRFVRAVFCNH